MPPDLVKMQILIQKVGRGWGMGMAGTGYNSAFLTSSQGMPVLPEYFKIKEFIMIRKFTTTFFFLIY